MSPLKASEIPFGKDLTCKPITLILFGILYFFIHHFLALKKEKSLQYGCHEEIDNGNLIHSIEFFSIEQLDDFIGNRSVPF
jgi:hypothetical protein